MKIAIVEDDSNLLDSLRVGLQEIDDIREVYGFSSAESGLKSIPSLDIDVVLMDINLPGISGVECVRKLLLLKPELPILMHTVFEDSEEVFAALRAGALSYILKRTPFNDLVEAIRATHAGETAMTPRIARHVVRYFQISSQEANDEDAGQELEMLTAREQEILRLVAKGFQNKEVARDLEITADTVRVHLRNIFLKWQVSNRTQAVAAFLSKSN